MKVKISKLPVLTPETANLAVKEASALMIQIPTRSAVLLIYFL